VLHFITLILVFQEWCSVFFGDSGIWPKKKIRSVSRKSAYKSPSSDEIKEKYDFIRKGARINESDELPDKGNGGSGPFKRRHEFPAISS
jgi:hypothetical protein